MNIQNFHAHLYYDARNISEAQELGDKVKDMFSVKLGRFHERPVGPHPTWSCQITVEPEDFGTVIPWLMMNHGSVDVFIHPNTGRDLEDHTNHVMWIGRSYPSTLRFSNPDNTGNAFFVIPFLTLAIRYPHKQLDLTSFLRSRWRRFLGFLNLQVILSLLSQCFRSFI